MWWTQDPADVQRCVMYGPIAARFRPASVHIFHQRAPVTTITAIANIAIANAIMPPSASSFGPVLVQWALSTSFTKKDAAIAIYIATMWLAIGPLLFSLM